MGPHVLTTNCNCNKGCTSIYRQLYYPFRTLINLPIKVPQQKDFNYELIPFMAGFAAKVLKLNFLLVAKVL